MSDKRQELSKIAEQIGRCPSGARAIIKFAGDVQIAEIVRCQFYL